MTGSSSDDNAEVAPHDTIGIGRWVMVVVLAVVTIIADQASKTWAVNALEFGDPMKVVPPLQFNLAFNTGMAFSRGASSGPLIGMIALGIVLVMLVVARRSRSPVQLVAIGTIIGGALGNVIDRLFRAGPGPDVGGFMHGAVVDFIDVQFWPIFNVADMAVVVGGFVLALSMIWVDDGEPDTNGDR